MIKIADSHLQLEIADVQIEMQIPTLTLVTAKNQLTKT